MPPYTFMHGSFVPFASVFTLSQLGVPYRIGKYFRVYVNVTCGGCGENHSGPPFWMSLN